LDGVVCYVGIGSNLGDPKKNGQEAVDFLAGTDHICLTRISSWYRTQPVVTGDGSPETADRIRRLKDQPWFINAVVEIKTILPVRDLFMALKRIEHKMGRTPGEKDGPRLIDLDLLFYGQDVVNEPDLVVPHPRAHQRRFVLEAMNEIASFYIHPVFGVSIRGLKDRLDDHHLVFRDGTTDSEGE